MHPLLEPFLFWGTVICVALALIILTDAWKVTKPVWNWFINPLWPEARISTASAQSVDSELYPNWPIHELFYYLRPDLKDDRGSMDWEHVGREVLDKFCHDEQRILKVSGRPLPTSVPDVFFGPGRLQPIPCKFWKDADFTYSFLNGESARDKKHTSGGIVTYVDLHVNKAGARQVWPSSLASAALSVLGGLLEDGSRILSAPVKNQAELARWKTSYDLWTNTVCKVIEKNFNSALAQRFRTVGVPTSKVFSGSFDDWHNSKRGRLFARMDNLKTFIGERS